MRVTAFAIALVLSLFSAASHAWWNEDWSGRKKINLSNPAGEVVDAPVLIRLHTGNFDFLSANENVARTTLPLILTLIFITYLSSLCPKELATLVNR